MNRQLNYIASAFLLLIVIGGAYQLLIRLSFTQPTANTTLIETQNPVNLSHTETQATGKNLFLTKCATCHHLLKDATGPSLLGFTEREPWTDRQNVYDWIKNPAAFIKKNIYVRELKNKYSGLLMTAFPDMKNEEIDAICDYIADAEKVKYMPVATK
jgi:cytochrome c2